MGWLGAIIIGGIAGWIAEKIMDADHGILTNIALGVAGALILNVLLVAVFGGTMTGVIGRLVIAVIGACLLILGYRMVRARS